MRAGLMGVVASVVLAAGALAEPADFGFYKSFYQKMNGFFGQREVRCRDYLVELQRKNHLQLKAVDKDTEVRVIDVGCDGFGHNGDKATCTHRFGDGSIFTMEISCRDGWNYTINSKLSYEQNGTNAFVDAEFDPSTCLKFIPFGERIVRMKVRPVEKYAGIVYTGLIDSALKREESMELPYGVIKDVFDNVEKDLPRIKGKRETLGHNLVRNSEAFVVLAKQKIRAMKDKNRPMDFLDK